jgi:hypothetical protein
MNNLTSRQVSVAMSAVFVVLCAIAFLYFNKSPNAELSMDTVQSVQPSTELPQNNVVALSEQTTTNYSELPPGVSKEQWAQLVTYMKSQPEGLAQLSNVDGYLRYTHLVNQWHESKATNEPASKRKVLTDQILTEMDAQFNARFLSADEAVTLARDVLSDQHTNPLVVKQHLDQKVAQLKMAQPFLANDETEESKKKLYKQKEEEIIAKWQQNGASGTDTAELSEQLQKARIEIYRGTL